MAINNGEVIGEPQKNLILETAGRIYVKVADRYYELNFRNQGSTTKIVGVPQVAPTETASKEEIDLSDYVTSAELKQTLKKYVTERSWQDVKDTQAALEDAMIEGFSESISPITIQTMQVTVGSEQYQFDIVKSFTDKSLADAPLYLDVDNEYHLTFNPCFIKHYTIDGPDAVQPDADKEYWRWYIDCSDDWDKEEGEKEIILLSNETYYFYFKVPFVNNIDVAGDDVIGGGTNGANLYLKDGTLANKTGSGIYAKTGVGKLIYTTEAQEFETVDENGVTWYNLLYAIVANSDGEPSISTMNGYTEILPGQITAYLFKNASGTSYLDLNSNQFVLGVDPEDPLLAFNQDGKGTLYLKGAIVQDRDGNSQSPTVYRDSWSADDTYCPGNIVVCSNSDGVVGSYRFTGILPDPDDSYVYIDDKTNDGQPTDDGKTYKYLEEYERECGTAGSPLEDTTHWICVSSGSKTIITAGLYYVDSDNDFIAVPTDSDDLILLPNINTDITLTAYEGASEMNITEVNESIPSDISNAVTVTKAVDGNIRIQNISFVQGAKFSGTDQITFEVHATSTTDSSIEIIKYFKFTVSAVKNADPTTVYQLKPSLTIIKKDASGTYLEPYITCDVLKTSSNGREIITDWNPSKIKVSYKIDGGDRDSQEYSYGQTIDTASISNEIEFALTVNDAAWDKETVYVVSDGANGDDGVRGVDAPIVRCSKWEANTAYNNGTNQEEIDGKSIFYLDIVYDPATQQYYQCNTSHTSGTTFSEDSGKWSQLNKFKPIATSVLFAGNEENGWIIDEGEIKHTGNKSLLTNAGEIYLGNSDTSKEPTADTANFSVDADGKVTVNGKIITDDITAISGTLEALTVKRSKNPFTKYSSSTPPTVDNVYTDSLGGTKSPYILDWTPASSGRRLTIVGAIEITAPPGKYFYENGRCYTTFQSTYGCTEMLGYGDEDFFSGWIVLNRSRIAAYVNYGRELTPVAIGKVDGSTSGSASFATLKVCDTGDKVDGSNIMKVTHAGVTGFYYLDCPVGWFAKKEDIYVDVTGIGSSVGETGTWPVKASVYDIDDEISRFYYRITIAVSDDSSANDGSFYFKLYNMAQWDDV